MTMWASSPRPSPVQYSCTPARACLRETSKPPWHTLPSRWETQGRLRGGAPRHPHQSKYFSAPTLTSIKISQQDRTAIDYPSHHPLFCCSDSWFWHGGWFWWHNAIICHCANCCHVKILLSWKLSFMSHFLTRHKTLTDNFTQLWWKLLVSADRY